MYRYRYINKMSQFGRTACTLILDDLEGVMPSVRFEKEFPFKIEDLDEELLYQEAAKEIIIAQKIYEENKLMIEQEAQIAEQVGE